MGRLAPPQRRGCSPWIHLWSVEGPWPPALQTVHGIQVLASEPAYIEVLVRGRLLPDVGLLVRLDPLGRIEAWRCFRVGMRSLVAEWFLGAVPAIAGLLAFERVRRACTGASGA